MTLGDRFLDLYDRYVGRWTNVWFNVGLGVLFGGGALIIDPGWVRDLWWFLAGTNLGYALMWLTYPRFSKARQREMEAEMDRLVAESLSRHRTEAWNSLGRMLSEVAGEQDDKPRRLQ